MLTVDVDDLGFLPNGWTSWQLVNIHGVLHRLLDRRGQERAKEVFIGCNLCLLVFSFLLHLALVYIGLQILDLVSYFLVVCSFNFLGFVWWRFIKIILYIR